MRSITIKVEDLLFVEMQKALKPLYTTKTEFIREAIRDKLKKQETDYYLRKYFGSLKPKNDLTDRELRELAGKELFEKFNLD